MLRLFPEGLGESQCWAWVVEPASRLPTKYGMTCGSDKNKEIARRQAEMAAMAYGYEFEVVDPNQANPAHVCVLVRGLPLSEAVARAQSVGLQVRIGSQDGRGAILTQDINRERITLTVMAGVVTNAVPG